MSDTNIIGLIAFVTSLIAVVTPILKLNSNITKLNINFENMLANDKVRDERITKHGNEIDEIKERQRSNEKILEIHNFRIGTLEKKNDISLKEEIKNFKFTHEGKIHED